MEDLKKSAESAVEQLNQGIHSVTRTVLQSAGVAQGYAKEAYQAGLGVVDEGKVYVDQGLAIYRETEDVVFSNLKYGLEWGASNPYIAYPVAGLGSLLVLPFTRRLLYRSTLGRFRSEEGVFRACDGKVQGLKTRVEDFGKDVEKLEARMRAAEEEMRNGMSKLKSTRQELQRLSGQLDKSERSATAIVKELRTLSSKVSPNLLQVRGEAAGQAASLRSQRTRVNKYINRILNQDV